MSQADDVKPDPRSDPLAASVTRAAARARADGCPEAEVLALYVEGELDPATDEHAAVTRHVEGCGRCQAVVAALVRTRPEGQAAPEGAPATGRSGGSWLSGWRWLAPVASAAAVALVAVWMGRPPSTDDRPEPATARAVEAGDARRQQASRGDAPTAAPALAESREQAGPPGTPAPAPAAAKAVPAAASPVTLPSAKAE